MAMPLLCTKCKKRKPDWANHETGESLCFICYMLLVRAPKEKRDAKEDEQEQKH